MFLKLSQDVKSYHHKSRDIVKPVVERNAYGAHHETILTAMVSSTNESVEDSLGKKRGKQKEE